MVINIDGRYFFAIVVETLSLDTINVNSLQSLQQTLQTLQKLRVGTERVRSGSSYDILWGGLQKHGKKFGRYQIFSYICTVLKDKCYENSSRLYSNN